MVIPFLLRRYSRILVPLVVAVAIERLLAIRALDAVVWSLYAELVYYSLYPLMLRVQRKVGWFPIIAVTAVLSTTMVAVKPQYTYPWQFSPAVMWVVGFPVWLLGCVVVEKWRGNVMANSAAKYRWGLRGLMWILSAAVAVLHFHGGIPFTRTLILFGAFSCIWIAGEIAHFNNKVALPNQIFEWAGKWSYSLYLIHPLVYAVWKQDWGIPAAVPGYLLLVILTLVIAFAFYLGIERPSHRLARQLGARLATS